MAVGSMSGSDATSALAGRRQLLTLLAYAHAGSHKETAHRLGISESTSRQRISQLCRRLGVGNAAQALWRLRLELEAEQASHSIDVRAESERAFGLGLVTPKHKR